jgi:predicted  nucleic acid-binding Zn-ribbon protein
MKNLFLVITAAFLGFHGAFAQLEMYARALMNTPFIAFEESQLSFRDKTAPASGLLITADEDSYNKELKNWLKVNYGIECKKISGFYSSPQSLISEWSADSLVVHYKVDKDGDATRLWVILEKKAVFLSQATNPEEIMKMKASLTTHIKGFYVKYYDEKIADAQKYYDIQIHDLEKLNKKHEKLQGEVKNNKATIDKNNNKLRDADSAINESDSKIKLSNSELQNRQKASDQAQKEVDDQQKLISTKESEYNKLNAAGSLNTREGERVIKDLEKLRGKMEKLRDKQTDTAEEVTKVENDIIEEERNKTKLDGKKEEYRREMSDHESKIKDLEGEISKNESDTKDEQQQVEAALADLEKLKTAKMGVTGIDSK